MKYTCLGYLGSLIRSLSFSDYYPLLYYPHPKTRSKYGLIDHYVGLLGRRWYRRGYLRSLLVLGIEAGCLLFTNVASGSLRSGVAMRAEQMEAGSARHLCT